MIKQNKSLLSSQKMNFFQLSRIFFGRDHFVESPPSGQIREKNFHQKKLNNYFSFSFSQKCQNGQKLFNDFSSQKLRLILDLKSLICRFSFLHLTGICPGFVAKWFGKFVKKAKPNLVEELGLFWLT